MENLRTEVDLIENYIPKKIWAIPSITEELPLSLILKNKILIKLNFYFTIF